MTVRIVRLVVCVFSLISVVLQFVVVAAIFFLLTEEIGLEYAEVDCDDPAMRAIIFCLAACVNLFGYLFAFLSWRLGSDRVSRYSLVFALLHSLLLSEFVLRDAVADVMAVRDECR